VFDDGDIKDEFGVGGMTDFEEELLVELLGLLELEVEVVFMFEVEVVFNETVEEFVDSDVDELEVEFEFDD